MPTKIKISICTFLTFFCAMNVKGQFNLQWGKKIVGQQTTGLYRTAEDFKNDHIEDVGKIDNVQTNWFMANKKFYMFKKADYYGFKDDFGNRYRVINGVCYNVLSYGKIYLYSNRGYCFNTRDDKGNTERTAADGYNSFLIYYAFDETSELKRLMGWDKKNNSAVGELLFQDNVSVKTNYVNDDSDDYEPNHKNVYADNLERLIHYVDVYNGFVK